LFSGLLDELDKAAPHIRTLFDILCCLYTERISLTALETGARTLVEETELEPLTSPKKPTHHGIFTSLFRLPRKQTRVPPVGTSPPASIEIVSSILMHKEAHAEVIENLTKLSLARCTFDSILTIHDLTRDYVMACIRERGDNDPIKVAARLVSNALRSIKDPKSPTLWPLCSDLVTHLRHQILDSEECDGSSQQYQAAIIGAQYLHAAGHYQASRDLLTWVNCRAIVKFSADDPERMRIIDMLGASFREAGKYDEATYHCQLAFAGREKVLGPDHPATLSSANNLATLYHDQGKYDEAAVLYKRSFAGREKALGPDHPSTLKSAADLAHVYCRLGKYDDGSSRLTVLEGLD
jgi:tetratricopeptide (TPR) repeat protein